MDVINSIESWSYPAVELVMLFFCLDKFRNRGGKLLAIGFGISIVASLTWRSLSFLSGRHYDDIHSLYEMFNHISFLLHIASSVFLIVGLSQIADLVNIRKNIAIDDKQEEMSLSQILFSFTGRMSRRRFWTIWLSMFVASLMVEVLLLELSDGGHMDKWTVISIFVIVVSYTVPAIWIGIAMQMKRWHDRNKSGWMILVGVIPIIGWIWAIVELGFLRGTVGPNQYGADPLPPIEDQNPAITP